jgi:NADH:ubiquinone oxidoreductase subunit 4 (subunit M)
MSTAKPTTAQFYVTVALAVLILLPSMYGFVGKFIEFVYIFRGEPGGEFAVAPIMNYLLASLGFFCLLLWAAANGMWRDVEQAKLDMLEREKLLDGIK